MQYNREAIIEDIKSMEIHDFYLKYIIKSYNWYFSEYQNIPHKDISDRIDQFKEIISKSFSVSFHSAQLVGSAKLGISLSPSKNFRPFVAKSDDERIKESDIDVAIISEKLFQKIWEDLRAAKNKCFIPNYQLITSQIFNGYINDCCFTDIPIIRREWNEKIASATMQLQDKLNISHHISFRIYRTWEDIEEYQISSIRQSKEKI